MKILCNQLKRDTIPTIKEGFIVCPTCRSLMHGVKLEPNAIAAGILIRCSRCKTEYKLNIDSSGQRSISSQRP